MDIIRSIQIGLSDAMFDYRRVLLDCMKMLKMLATQVAQPTLWGWSIYHPFFVRFADGLFLGLTSLIINIVYFFVIGNTYYYIVLLLVCMISNTLFFQLETPSHAHLRLIKADALSSKSWQFEFQASCTYLVDVSILNVLYKAE